MILGNDITTRPSTAARAISAAAAAAACPGVARRLPFAH